MKAYKKLKKNTLLTFIGNIGSKLITFIMLPFYTKYLNPELYGELELINSTISFLFPILTLQTCDAIFRLSKNRNEIQQNKLLSSGIFVSIFTIFCFGIFVSLYLKKIHFLRYNYFLIITTLIFNFIEVYLKQFMRSINKMNIYVLSGVINTVLSVVLGVILIPKYQIDGVLISNIFASCFVVLYILIREKIYSKIITKYIEVKIIREILKYSIPLIPNAVIWWIMGLSDRYFLNYYYGAYEVGLYSVANKFPSLINTLFSLFYISWQITAIEEYKSEDYCYLFNKIFGIISNILIMACVGIIIIIKPVMYYFLPLEYYKAWQYVPILSYGLIFYCYASFIGVNYIATKNTKGIFKTSLLSGVINIALNFILIPKYSLLGAVVATFLSYLILFIIRMKESKDIVELKINLKQLSNIITPILFYILIILNKSRKNEYILIVFLLLIISYIKRKEIKDSIQFFKSKRIEL